MANAPALLGAGRFTTTAEARAARKAAGAPPPGGTTKIIRPFGGRSGGPTPYVLVSNAARLAAADWARVLAVVVTGEEWQFQGWPMVTASLRGGGGGGGGIKAVPGGVLEALRAVHGVYFHYLDEPVRGGVGHWPITRVALAREKRHEDPRAVEAFWRSIDDWARAKAPHLEY
ncbi:hypothetical protein BU14_0031s0109 [Porphyra umbilicalis]|uniref:Cell division control protein 73 C-terminal domain-containing protein n=1 Tax=Porphyra umbilicalis TaxID=2786 RepID=A0A1X6PJA0_PORUM|nr:hypothetical protein BU14_0031s0109 [Porphyra umbilicalis]|eukprot:OSX80941.1 hypothetical protein BU14_0031s0109 [Porphyra umbilicalis]